MGTLSSYKYVENAVLSFKINLFAQTSLEPSKIPQDN